jgi:hypothetical protein
MQVAPKNSKPVLCTIIQFSEKNVKFWFEKDWKTCMAMRKQMASGLKSISSLQFERKQEILSRIEDKKAKVNKLK